MASLIITDRIVAFLPNSAQGQSRDALAAFEQDCKKLGLRIIENGQFLFACNVLAEKEDRGAEETLVLDIFPGTAASGRPFERLGDMPNWAAHHEFLEQEAQCYNLFCLRPNGLELESDQLGLKALHTAKVPRGTFFFSRILDGLKTEPDLCRPFDRVALRYLLSVRATIDTRTLHEKIKRTKSGARYRFSNTDGLDIHSDRRLRAHPIRPTILSGTLFNETYAAVSDSIRNKQLNLAKPLYLGMSGGHDSRLIAAISRDEGIPLTGITYGNSYHPELKNARAIAKFLGLKLMTTEVDKANTIETLPTHLELVEGTADPSTSSIAHLLQFQIEQGAGLMHGFAADAWHGEFINALPEIDQTDFTSLAAAIARVQCGSTVDEDAMFGWHVEPGQILQDIEEGLPSDCEPHQANLIWNMENKQRRYTASLMPIMASRFDPILPFYDQAVFDVWTSIPPVALDGRHALRRFLATKYPDLARIPHSEEAYPIIPNFEYQLKYLISAMPEKVLTRLLGRARSKSVIQRVYRDRYIWSLANLASRQHQKYMCQRIVDLRDIADEIFGLQISKTFEQLTDGNVQARRMLFMVCEYALHLKRELGIG